jgi:NADPH:quinone reductase-like Zn-dependent oxidoreductase
METMRAALYRRHGGAEEVTVETVPMPRPGPGQVLVRLAAAGVAPLDWKLRAGLLRRHFTLGFPKIPGRDGAGEVIACGAGVTGIGPGDRVAVMAPPSAPAGTHAEAIVADARLCVPVPAPLGLIEAAALVNAGLSAFVAVVRTAGVQAGQRVLVHSGAGAVGGLMVQMAADRGAIVTATCRAANRDYVIALGAARAIAYDAPFPNDLPPQDVIFDLMGGAVHDACYPLLAPGGHLVWLTAAPITDRGADYGVRVSRAVIVDDAEPVAATLAMAAAGRLKAQIAATLPLAKAAEAQQRLESGQVTRGRLLLLT